MKRLLTMIVLTLALVGFSVTGSNAYVKKIRMDQLKPADSRDVFLMHPGDASSADHIATEWQVEVKLPVGKRITKLLHYHKGVSVTAFTQVVLIRVKMGEEIQTIGATNSTDESQNIISVESPGIEYPVVKSGYTYCLHVSSYNEDSQILGIKIFYQD